TVSGLSGATSGNQRTLRAGIDHYDSSNPSDSVTTTHTFVAISQTDWLGAPGGGQPPVNSGLPVISGQTLQGQTVSSSTGTWSNSPTGFSYQWLRCDTGGANCANLGAAGPTATYLLVAADVGSTIKVTVTATNAGGSASATSVPTGVVTAPPAPVNTGLP